MVGPRFGLPSPSKLFSQTFPNSACSRQAFQKISLAVLWKLQRYTIGKPKKIAFFQIFDVSEGSKSPSRAAKPIGDRRRDMKAG